MSCLGLAQPSMLTCTACRLHRYRTQVVPGHGPTDALIWLVGEAPGKREDEVGEPFIGPAGVKLDEMLVEAGITIAVVRNNVVLCRPPDNDLRPYPDALLTCPSRWLLPDIERLKPRVIVALGMTAASLWFPGAERISDVAGVARALPSGVIVVASFHPSYTLRGGGKWAEGSIVNALRRAREVVQ